MPSHINIEDRYRLSAIRERQVCHSGLFTGLGLLGGAALTAGGNAYSANVSKSASDRAADEMKKAGNSYGAALNNALNAYNEKASKISAAVSKINPNIQVADFTLFPTETIFEVHTKGKKAGEIKTDKKGNPIVKKEAQRGAILDSVIAASMMNEAALLELEKILPGSANAREKANETADKWESLLERQFAKSEQASQMLQESRQIIRDELPQLGNARALVDKWMKGDMPEQTRKEIARNIAETAGAGFSPEAARRTGGFQSPQGMLSQNIMRDIEARQMRGLEGQLAISQLAMGMAGQEANIGQAFGQQAQVGANISEAARAWQGTRQSWQQLAGSFMTRPTDIMQLSLSGMGQNIQKEQMGIQNQFEQQRIQADLAIAALNAATGGAGAQYSASTGTTQARLASGLSSAQGIANVYGTVGEGISSAALAYGQYSTAQPTNYGSGAVTGFRGQTYVPDQGGQAYRPVSGSIY